MADSAGPKSKLHITVALRCRLKLAQRIACLIEMAIHFLYDIDSFFMASSMTMPFLNVNDKHLFTYPFLCSSSLQDNARKLFARIRKAISYYNHLSVITIVSKT